MPPIVDPLTGLPVPLPMFVVVESWPDLNSRWHQYVEAWHWPSRDRGPTRGLFRARRQSQARPIIMFGDIVWVDPAYPSSLHWVRAARFDADPEALSTVLLMDGPPIEIAEMLMTIPRWRSQP